MSSDHWPRISSQRLSFDVRFRNQARWSFGLLCKMGPNDMAICFGHPDSFKLDQIDQYFHLILWLKVNNDTVVEASVLEYDRYKPPLGPRPCHRYLGFCQDLKMRIYYVNQVLLVILRLMGAFKMFLNTRCADPLLRQDLAPYKRLVWSHGRHFQVKGASWHVANRRNTSRYVLKGCHITSK